MCELQHFKTHASLQGVAEPVLTHSIAALDAKASVESSIGISNAHLSVKHTVDSFPAQCPVHGSAHPGATVLRFADRYNEDT